MLKKLKWVLLGFLSIGIIVLTFVVTLLNYAETEVNALELYRLSVASLPEVDVVKQIHRFNGIESYIVAHVVVENGYDVYYFIYEDTVQHFFFASQLITEAEAHRIAQSQIIGGEIIRIQLGLLNEIPIFEVQVEADHFIYFIIINAQDGEVKMNFQI